MNSPLMGYKRQYGRWGLRNHVLVLPLHSALTSVAREIADACSGAVALGHDWSGESDNDLPRIIKTLAGCAANPNLHSVLFLTLDTAVEQEIIALARSLTSQEILESSLPKLGSISLLKQSALAAAKGLVARASV